MDKIPDCIRCGMCCIICCCYDSSMDTCLDLIVHQDLTTSCGRPEILKSLIGTGCVLRYNTHVYDTYKEYYQLTKRKKEML